MLNRVKILLVCVVMWVAGPALAETDPLAAIKQGEANVVLMRHALAPGTGDPYDFTLGQCDTQRNLNDVGRQQATDTGAFLRSQGIEFDVVYTSQWCRCVETAERLKPAQQVIELPQINSFFQEMEKSDEQTRALQQWLADKPVDELLILVTHQVNITAYTGVYPRSGELVVGRFDASGEFTLVGRVDPR